MKTKNWNGIELPRNLAYEEAVTHVLDNLHKGCGLIDIDFDRDATEKVLRSWGLATGVDILLEITHGRRKEWWELWLKHTDLTRLQKSNRYR